MKEDISMEDEYYVFLFVYLTGIFIGVFVSILTILYCL